MPTHCPKDFAYADSFSLHSHSVGEVQLYCHCPHFTFCFLNFVSVWGASTLLIAGPWINMWISQLIFFSFYHFTSSKNNNNKTHGGRIYSSEILYLTKKTGLWWEILRVILKSITFHLWSPWNKGKWLKAEFLNILDGSLEMILFKH